MVMYASLALIALDVRSEFQSKRIPYFVITNLQLSLRRQAWVDGNVKQGSRQRSSCNNDVPDRQWPTMKSGGFMTNLFSRSPRCREENPDSHRDTRDNSRPVRQGI
jgi:hypothetical protein